MSEPIQTPPVGTEEVEPLIPEVEPVEPTAELEPEIEEPAPATEPTLEPEPAPAPAPQPAPTLDERYRNSSSEAMILNSKNKNLESTLEKLTSADAPTESEILADYPDFAEQNATTKRVMTDLVISKKRQLRIDRRLIEQDAKDQFKADLKAVTSKTEYASLAGDKKFEEFVLKPSYAGVDIETLADAYLVRTGKAQAAPVPATPPAPPANSGLPRGSGGPRGQLKPAKITLEQAKVLRETNWKEYLRQAKAGNIEEIE